MKYAYLAALFSMLMFTLFTAGYAVKKYDIRIDPRCINSACDAKCKTTPRFVRHAGVCK